MRVLVSEVLAGLSHALDITEGHPRGHSARSCLIAMRLAKTIGLTPQEQADLFYAALLKDAGCSSNAARVHQLFGGDDQETKRAVWLRDWRQIHNQLVYALRNVGRGEGLLSRVKRLRSLAAQPEASREIFQIRCYRGAQIARDLGLTEATAQAIRSMDEHWDGGGHPDGLSGLRIPLLARVVGLAQVLEIFAMAHGPAHALRVVKRRRGRWFDPALVDAAGPLAKDDAFWRALQTQDERRLVAEAEPAQALVEATPERLDGIADAFASVVDAKSPYTSDHSRRVASIAEGIAARLDCSDSERVSIHRAGLLHDIGKLGVPNAILDKQGPLTPDEWRVVKLHPRYSFEILDRVPVFRSLAADAAAHHETLNGSGYHLGLDGYSLSRRARILAVADRADALLADRPYRAGLSPEETLAIVRRDESDGRVCAEACEALAATLSTYPKPATTGA